MAPSVADLYAVIDINLVCIRKHGFLYSFKNS